MKKFRYWRNLTLFGLAALLLISSLIVLGLSYQAVQNYIHPDRDLSDSGETPANYGIPYTNVILETRDGLQLKGWYTKPDIGDTSVGGPVILVAHGHSARRDAGLHAFFAEAGYGVLSWDFRAHGTSQGEISTIGYNEALDVEAALDYVLQKDGVTHVGAWGGSMGAAAVIGAAARREEIEAVVVDSAFAAIDDELEIIVNVPVMRPVVRFFMEYETGLQAEMLKPENQIGFISPRPVFIIQGQADRVIKADSAERLYTSAGEPRFMWSEPNVDHLGMRKDFPDEYQERVIEFFNRALLDQ